MEVPQVEEVRLSAELDEAEHRREIRSAEPHGRKCVYNKDITCTAPDCKLDICSRCPYGYACSFTSTLRDVFGKIVSLAIFLAKSDDVLRDVIAYLSKANEVEQKTERELHPEKNKQKPEQKINFEDEVVVSKQPLPKGSINTKPIKQKISSAQDQMSAQIAKKVADINEALANPDGSPEKPLV